MSSGKHAVQVSREVVTSRAPSWLAEFTGVAIALALALVAVVHMDVTDRSWMLYYDPETVLPALVRGSVLSGQPQDWALSAVLFIPEMGLYLALAALGFGVKGTFALNAVVNFVLLYASLRLVSGVAQGARPRSHRVVGALAAFAGVVALTLTEDSSRWDTFELVSLLATATFYSMTVLAAVVTTGIVASLAGFRDGWRRLWLEAALIIVSAFSTLTNPLYLAWEGVPIVVVLALAAWRRAITWGRLARVTAILALGGGLGLVGRIPFAQLISKDGPAYAKPGLAEGTAIYYLQMLSERTSTVAGALSLTPVVALILVAVLVFRRSIANRDVGAVIVSGVGWVAPLAVVAGAVTLGAVGTRYLQPVFFAPICTLVFAPRLFTPPQAFRRSPSRRAVRVLLGGSLAAVSLVASTLLTEALGSSSATVSPDVRCVDSWISSNNRAGAGRFWSIRGPKAYLAEPYRLIQVDDSFRAYPWLADRADYSTARVSFVLSSVDYPPPTLPPGTGSTPSSVVHCGRYTITDFGADVLPIQPASPDSRP